MPEGCPGYPRNKLQVIGLLIAMTRKVHKEDIDLLKKEIRYARDAANITASLVVKEFVKREEVLQRLVKKSEIELELRNELEKKVNELEIALEEIKTLQGIIPISSCCKKIRDDKGYWERIETYISKHSEAAFSHGICPACAKKLYPDLDIYGED